ncbi:MAG: amidohydrolase family protein [Tepidisphaera sp.]
MTPTVLIAMSASVLAALPMGLAQPGGNPPTNGPRQTDPNTHILVGGTLHPTPADSDTLADAVVIVRAGMIQAVGTRGSLPQDQWPAGAQVWDVSGQHLYAGFIDPFVEVEVPRPTPEAGANTTQRHWNVNIVAERHALDQTGLDRSTAESLRRMGFGTVALVPMDPGKRRGGVLRGTSAVVSLLPGPTGSEPNLPQPRVYVPSWAMNASFETAGGFGSREDGEGSGWFGSYPTSRMGALALLRQTIEDARARVNSGEPLPAWAAAITASRPFVFDVDNEIDAMRAVGFATEFSLPAIVVGSGTEYRRVGAVNDAVKTLAAASPNLKQAHPWIVPLNDPRAPDVSSVGRSEETDLRTLMAWEQAPTNLARLEDSGVRASLTTSKLRDRGEFLTLLRKAVDHGLPKQAALAMVTTRPAELTGTSDRLGTVAPGKVANLIVADQELFASASTTPDESKNDQAKEDASDKSDSEARKPSGTPKIMSVWVEGRRFEFATFSIDVSGMWSVELPGAKGPPSERFIQFDGELGGTPFKSPKATIIKDGKRATAQVKTDSLNPDGITLIFDHEPLDKQQGMFTLTGTVLRENGKPAAFVGKGLRPDGRTFDFRSTRLPAATAIGTWRVTEADGALKNADAKDQLFLTVTASKVDLKFTKAEGDPTLISAEDVVAAGNLLRFRHSLKNLGGEGDSVDSITIDGDSLIGESTLPDGSKHAYKAVRVQPEAEPARKGDRKPKFDDKLVGRWRITLIDGQPNPDRGTLHIKSDGKVVLNGRGRIVAPTEASLDDSKLTYTVDLKSYGGEGEIKSSASLKDGALEGTMTLTNGRAVMWRAERQPGNPDVLADIPETIPVPFQAYGTLPPAFGSGEEPDTVIRNATVWTLGPKNTLKDATVAIASGKIVFVGTADEFGAWLQKGVRLRQPWREIDAKGKHVTPGIIDCHSHTGLRNANESGRAVTSMVRIEDELNPDDINWYRQLAGGVTAVNNLHGSANSIGGQNTITKLRWGVVDPLGMKMTEAAPGIKFALGENPKRGNSGNQSTYRYPQTRMGVEAQIRDRFHAAREYAAARAKDPKHPRDLELEPLAEILAGTRLVHCHSYRQDEILMLSHVARDFGFKIGTYQHILEGYKVAEALKEHSGGASGFSDWWAFKVEVQDAIPFAFPLMHRVGVLCSFNSDDSELARRLNTEAAKAVKYGRLSDEEALAFVTLNPAKQLKIDAFVGSVEEGKQADLVVWSGHPLSSLTRCERTFVDGVQRFSIEQDAHLRAQNAADRERITQKLLKDKSDRSSSAGPRTGGGGGSRRRPTEESGKDAGGGRGECGTEEIKTSTMEAAR